MSETTGKLCVGDQVERLPEGNYLHPFGKVVKVIPGGYEVLWSPGRFITNENDESVMPAHGP